MNEYMKALPISILLPVTSDGRHLQQVNPSWVYEMRSSLNIKPQPKASIWRILRLRTAPSLPRLGKCEGRSPHTPMSRYFHALSLRGRLWDEGVLASYSGCYCFRNLNCQARDVVDHSTVFASCFRSHWGSGAIVVLRDSALLVTLVSAPQETQYHSTLHPGRWEAAFHRN